MRLYLLVIWKLYPHNLTNMRLPKHDLNKDHKRHTKVDEGKNMNPQSHKKKKDKKRITGNWVISKAKLKHWANQQPAPLAILVRESSKHWFRKKRAVKNMGIVVLQSTVFVIICAMFDGASLWLKWLLQLKTGTFGGPYSHLKHIKI